MVGRPLFSTIYRVPPWPRIYSPFGTHKRKLLLIITASNTRGWIGLDLVCIRKVPHQHPAPVRCPKLETNLILKGRTTENTEHKISLGTHYDTDAASDTIARHFGGAWDVSLVLDIFSGGKQTVLGHRLSPTATATKNNSLEGKHGDWTNRRAIEIRQL